LAAAVAVFGFARPRVSEVGPDHSMARFVHEALQVHCEGVERNAITDAPADQGEIPVTPDAL